jgi:hypothetical protein
MCALIGDAVSTAEDANAPVSSCPHVLQRARARGLQFRLVARVAQRGDGVGERPATRALPERIVVGPAGGLRPYGLAIAPSGAFAVVGNVGKSQGDNDTIALVDLESELPRAVHQDLVAVGRGPIVEVDAHGDSYF